MPTRARPRQTITLSAFEPLTDLRLALLRRDFQAAESVWARSPVPAPPHRAAWYRNGARLFLMLGHTDMAQALVWNAILLSPTETKGWFLLHLILREMRDWRAADDALDVALHLEPLRTKDLLWDRWMLAVENEDIARMAALAESFSIQNPSDPLRAYFAAKTLLIAGETDEAVTQLIDTLQAHPHAPAVLWSTLGEAYLELDAYHEAQSVLEVAAQRFYEGDRESSYLEVPFLESLNFSLAKAYLGNGACANAEAVLRRLAASQVESRGASRFDAWIEQAIRCQTPTPTLTPWIPKQYGTATPIPPRD